MTVHGAARSGDPLTDALARARGILPDQGPIGVFVHHNTLHAFQHLSFHDGVRQGAALLGARPYPELAAFRDRFAEGRIEARDLDAELEAALGARGDEALQVGVARRTLWRLLLVDTLDLEDEPGLRWRLREPSPLLAAAADRSAALPLPPLPAAAPRRHRDALLGAGAEDVDVAVHSELIRLSAAFLDHGQARVELPARERGFFAAAGDVVRSGFRTWTLRGVADDFARWAAAGAPAEAAIAEVLEALGVSRDEAEDLLLATLLALPGWAGMFARLEAHPDERPDDVPVALVEFLAVRLAFERRAIVRVAADARLPVAWDALRAATRQPASPRPAASAFLLARVAEAAGLGEAEVRALPDAALSTLWAEAEALPDLDRRRLWLSAYERRYRRQVLDAVAARRSRPAPLPPGRPKGQFVFCIDEREESIRRAVEELDPTHLTYGVAGFFGLAVDYRGLEDDEAAAYCPVVVTPAHEIHERAREQEVDRHVLRARRVGGWRGIELQGGHWSRSLVGGAVASLILGPVAGALAAARVLAPRASLEGLRRLEATFAPRPGTELSSLRADEALRSDRGKWVGFTESEAADRVATLLVNIGLTRGFAPIVAILGHGSTSLNNPHESAHDCGACGGRRGGGNARLFADLANRPEVRAGLRERGIDVPEDTWFVGALHDTSDDLVTWYDADQIPAALRPGFDHVRKTMESARRANALERARRFHDAPLELSPESALRHVEGRASALGQPRPEYGHCTNASAIVGRRDLTRGLHLDRRAFLISYDPDLDPDGAVIERILAAVGPVGAGINLEYYFSSVDNEVFGCGTKLPHNVTGLIGIMNGHCSDLRTGLPWQMVELHEPMRLLLVVEAAPEVLLAVAGRQAEVRELVVNRWIQLVSVHPETGELAEWTDAGFVPYVPEAAPMPVVERSSDWNRRSRAHQPPALIVTEATR